MPLGGLFIVIDYAHAPRQRNWRCPAARRKFPRKLCLSLPKYNRLRLPSGGAKQFLGQESPAPFLGALLRQLGSDKQGQGFGSITSRTFPPSGTSEICRWRSPRKETCSYRSTT